MSKLDERRSSSENPSTILFLDSYSVEDKILYIIFLHFLVRYLRINAFSIFCYILVRFPGSDDVLEFWKLLKNCENHVIEVTSDRFNAEAFHDKDRTLPGKTYAKHAGLLRE